MNYLNRVGASIVLAIGLGVLPAQAGYVIFRAATNTPWTYWTIYYHTGGSSNLALQAGQKQCQSQIEVGDTVSYSFQGIPANNAPRYPLAPYIRNACE
jgi:hypothetical protein